MAAKVLTKDTFQGQIQSGVTLVDFWAEWCGPCRVQLPIIEKLATELDGQATVAKVNVDEHGDLAAQFGITGIPALLIFKDGELVDRFVGLQDEGTLKKAVLAHV
ncbi:thioredoxin [Numidum massiliense]|uniref:thioredoxin n=1 Tax=Numidum massiliense TaxID=1522315 RepID=UPI0006D531B1|nr:thioredoxin [Numidum massiliense]